MRERYRAGKAADTARQALAGRVGDPRTAALSTFCDSLSSPLDPTPGAMTGRYALERDSFLPDRVLKGALCVLVLATVALCAWVATRAWMEL